MTKCAELHLQIISPRYYNYPCNLPERCLLYWLWLPLPENGWLDYSDFSIGFGCHCLRTDGLIIVTSQLALAATA